MRKYLIVTWLCTIPFFSFKEKEIPHCKLPVDHHWSLDKIPEPSGIAYDAASDHYFIVSDHGFLFECALDGKVIRKAEEGGFDFEGVEVTDSFVYVSDEIPRKIFKYRKSDLSLLKTYQVSWQGGANKAFESITYNQSKKCFVLVAEQPATIVEYDENFHELERHPFRHARDISDARWYAGSMYLLSDMDHTIFKCDPVSYQILAYYKIDVLNPEGLAFNAKGEPVITSDAMQRIYFFKNLPVIQ